MLTEANRRDRASGPTASSIAGILGLDPFKSPLTVWLEATGRQAPQVDEEAVAMGHLLEPVCRTVAEQRTGLRFAQPAAVFRPVSTVPGVVVGATADGMGEDAARGQVGLECKSHILAAADYGRQGTDEVPVHEWVQCQIGAWAYQTHHWYLAALVDNRVRVFHIATDYERGRNMARKAAEWWRDYVVADRQPPGSGSDRDREALTRLYTCPWSEKPILRPATEGERELAAELKLARAARIKAALAEGVVKQALQALIGEGQGIQVPTADPKKPENITWRTTKGSTAVDHQAALVDYRNRVELLLTALDSGADARDALVDVRQGPDLARFTAEKPGHRRFLTPRSWGKDPTTEEKED